MSYRYRKNHSDNVEKEAPSENEPIVYENRKLHKTESFVSRNVRLITFLICIGVFLLTFGPIAVMETYDYFANGIDTRPQMTLTDVIAFSDVNGPIGVKRIEKFACREQKQGDDVNTTNYYFDIEPSYMALAIVDNDSNMVIHFILAELDNTGGTVDVLKEDVRAFLEQN